MLKILMLKFASHQLLWKFWPYEPQKKVIMIIFFMIPVDIFSKIVEDVGVKLLNHDIFITCFANNIFFFGSMLFWKKCGRHEEKGKDQCSSARVFACLNNKCSCSYFWLDSILFIQQACWWMKYQLWSVWGWKE